MKVCCVFEENKLALFRNIFNKNMFSISLFSSREPKAQVSFIGQNVSVVVVVVVVIVVFGVVNFSHFHFYFQNHFANFNQLGTRHHLLKGFKFFFE